MWGGTVMVRERSFGAAPRWFALVALLHLAILVAVALVRAFDVVVDDSPLVATDLLGIVVMATALATVVGLWRLSEVASGLGAEAATASAREAHLLETTNEWIWSVDADGSILSSNAVVEQLLGYRVEEVIGRAGPSLIHPEERSEALDLRRSDIRWRAGWTGRVVRYRHRDGSDRWLESNAVAVLGDDGEVVGYRGASRDVTRRALDAQADAATRDAFREKRARIAAVVAEPTDRLRMVFQPIVARDGSIAGVEALARFTGPPNRSPDQWFAEADEVGLGLELELLAVRLATEQMAALPEGYVAVNLSPSSVLSSQLRDLVSDVAFPARRVVVELTEHVEVTRYDDLRTALEELRAVGLRVAVDDAGSGFSSLKHILELRPDFIKLDRSVVSGITWDPARRALAAAVADFAANIGARVIAEGVENREELQAVHVAGIGYAQGYLFGQPAAPPVTVDSPAPTGVRAIVVDDDPVVRLLVSSMARQAGIQVVGQASDGREGLELAIAEVPDVVVLDLSMPVMRGEEAIPELRRRLPEVFIVVLSAIDHVEAASRLAAGEANAFVSKEEISTRLSEVFASVLAGPKAEA